MWITGSNRESIHCLLNLSYSVVLIHLYSYNTGSLYDNNIQYTQLLYWACLIVHICYPVSFILGHSSVPMLSDLISFYWVALVDQDFIISPLFSMALSFVLGSLYWPIFLYITYVFGLLYHTNFIFGFF